VALPAYNEEDNLPGLLDRIRSVLTKSGLTYELVIVDDGSADGTGAVAEEYSRNMPVRVQRHPTNQGLGRTLADALAAAVDLCEDNDVIVTMDADGTHDPVIVPRMAELIGEGYDVVVASRYRPGASVRGVPWNRRILSGAARLLFRVVFPTRGIRDYTSGFRAYKGSALRAAIQAYHGRLVDQEGFQCMADVLLKLRRLGCCFTEVPITLRYDLKQGNSKMKVGVTVLRTLELLVRRRISM